MDSGEGQTAEPQGQARQRRRFPWRGVIIAGVVLLFLLLLTVGTIVAVLVAVGSGGGGMAGSAGPQNYQEEYVSGEGQSKIAVVPVEGTIAAASNTARGPAPLSTPEGLTDALQQAREDSSVEAVVLSVNSPGGGVTASDEMHQSILDFKESTDKPVVVSMGATAASGGYYISTAADQILANETTLTGSLGVYLSLLDLTGIEEEYGVSQRYIKSGEFKAAGNPWDELDEEEREIFLSIVESYYGEFVEVIVQGRDLSEERVREIADGRPYVAPRAMELGLVDELGGLEEANSAARELAGVENARAVRYVRPPGLLEGIPGLGGILAPEKPDAAQLVKEELGLEHSGKPMYLYRPGA